MYKFFGTPLAEIKSKMSGKVMFRFDSKGEFITDDPLIIDRALGFFDYIKLTAETTGDKVKKTVNTPPLKVESKDDKKYKCKKCSFQTDSKTELMAHYKTHKED